MTTAQDILDFWFGAEGSPEAGTMRPQWFKKDAAFDADIKTRFGGLIGIAIDGGLLDWATQPGPALARVLLLDQFTRNAFRDTPASFAGDALALSEARAMVATHQDQRLAPEQRMFIYMPFEHAENIEMQDEAVRLFSAMAVHAPQTKELVDYAEKHRAVIRRFGRFPHRNPILGRESTPEEVDFLKQPGSRF